MFRVFTAAKLITIELYWPSELSDINTKLAFVLQREVTYLIY